MKNRFQILPFKCNLQRYIAVVKTAVHYSSKKEYAVKIINIAAVGLCTLNQVDP